MKIIVFDIILFDYPVLWAPLSMLLLLLPSKVRIKVLEKSIGKRDGERHPPLKYLLKLHTINFY